MTKIAVIFLSLFAVSISLYPGKLYRENWGNKLMAYNLINMTLFMCKDAKLKLRMADHIQEDYKNSLAYELGLLASGINDKFKYMLQIYRYYSKHTDFKANKYHFESVMNAYHIMQSVYNEIRVEMDLFQDIINQQSKKKSKQDQELIEYAKKNPGVDIERLKQAKDAGLLPPGGLESFSGGRRSMGAINQTTNQKPQNKTDWNRKKDPGEAEYKKKLRYIMWAERWKGYNPEIEGVDIEHSVAKAGLENASEFSMKEFEGIFK